MTDEIALAWKQWLSDPAYHATIPETRYPDMLGLIAYALNRLPDVPINFVDVGAARGDVLRLLRDRTRLTRPIRSIGIDPVDFRGEPDYSHFVRGVVSDLPEQDVPFHVHEETSVSSMFSMIADNVVHDTLMIDGINYFAACDIETVRETISVRSWRLDTILKQHVPEKETIHFVKIDAQGADVSAFRSLGRETNRCLFVQIETVMRDAEGRDNRLYHGQSTLAEDRAVLEGAGFRLLNIADFVVTPECDAIFVNTSLFQDLGLDVALSRAAA